MTDRPALDAVLLDAGGTLVRLDFEWMSEALGEFGLTIAPAAVRRAEIKGRRAYDASRGVSPRPETRTEPLGGAGDINAYFGETLVAAGVPPEFIEPALARFLARHEATGLWTRPMEGAREALDALGGLGVRLAVVSNSDGRAESHLRDCGVLAGIEFVVDSKLVGVEKPDPAIFRIALDRLGVPSERALFVGDIRSVDEVGARAAGMRFVLLDATGAYAAPGTPRVAGMAALPEWVEATFDLSLAASTSHGGGSPAPRADSARGAIGPPG